jgi:hypothetical protein
MLIITVIIYDERQIDSHAAKYLTAYSPSFFMGFTSYGFGHARNGGVGGQKGCDGTRSGERLLYDYDTNADLMTYEKVKKRPHKGRFRYYSRDKDGF